MSAPATPVSLPHRIVEAVAVVGADQYSGLKPYAPQDEVADSTHTLSRQVSTSFYENVYQPLLTASLSESKAHFPDQVIFAPSSYPPAAFKRRGSSVRSKPKKEGLSPLQPPPADTSPRLSRRPSGQVSCVHNDEDIRSFVTWRRRLSVVKTRPQSALGPDGVIKAETIQGIPPLLYPDGLKIIKWTPLEGRPPETISYLSLTELNGGRLYSTALNWHRLFRVVRIEEGGQLRVRGVEEEELECEKMGDHLNGDDNEEEGPLIYAPCSILLISKQPYFHVMKQCLSAFLRVITERENSFESELMQFAACLTHTPVPPGGPFTIETSLLDSLIIMPPPLPVVRTTVDFDLSILLNAFQPRDIVCLLTILLTQQRLVLVANSLSHTVIACETLLLLLRPFQWRFPFVPTLTPAMVDFLEAPGPYFFGCIARHYMADLQRVKNTAQVFIADLTTGKIEIPEKLVPSFPVPPAEPCLKLFALLSRVRSDFASYMLERPALLTIEAHRRLHLRFDAFNNQMILLAFLEFMVELFQDYKQMVVQDSLKIFLSGQTDGKKFYENVCQCEIFTDFVRSRMTAEANDPFGYVERTMRIQQEGAKPKLSTGTFSRTRRRSSVALQAIEEIRTRPQGLGIAVDDCSGLMDFESFHLAAYNPSSHTNFLEANIQLLLQAIDATKSDTLMAALLRLKSELHLGLDEKRAALTAMLELSRKDIRLLCKTHARIVLQSLSQEELTDNADLVAEMSKLVDHSDSRQRALSSSLLALESFDTSITHFSEFRLQQQDHPLPHGEFATFLRMSAITKDVLSQERLFNLLTKNAGAYAAVDPWVFSHFYEGWKEVISCLMRASPSDEEIVKTTTESIRVDPAGTGRLILTAEQLKLTLFGAGAPPMPLFSFSSVTNIEKKASSSVLRRRPTLVISCSEKTPVTLWFPNEMEARWWMILLEELCAGSHISAEAKDRTLMEQALENVLLMDSCLRALQDLPPNSRPMPYNMEDVAAVLGNLTTLYKAEEFHLDVDTAKCLQRKINPCSMDAERRSIDALQAVPAGKKCGHALDLWCVCNDDGSSHNCAGRVLIVNANSSAVEASVLHAAKLMCMLKVGCCMWVGDFYHTIYIIDINSRQVTRELVEHKQNDGVVALATNADHILVASSSGSGEVLIWNPNSMEVKRRWTCSGRSGVMDMKFAPQNTTELWCCLRRSVLVFEVTSGECLREFQLDSIKNKPTEALQCLELDALRRLVYVAARDSSCLLVLDFENVQLQWRIDLPPQCHRRKSCPNCKSNKDCHRCRTSSKCRGISKLMVVNQELWVGCKDGNITVISDPKRRNPSRNSDFRKGDGIRRQLRGHNDAVQAMCSDDCNIVFTGGRAKDGKIATWWARES